MDYSADKVTVSEFLMRKQGFQIGTGVTVNSPPVTAPRMCWFYQQVYIAGCSLGNGGLWSWAEGSPYLHAMFTPPSVQKQNG